jgi:peptidoglycan hydrolase CwlO-like protein
VPVGLVTPTPASTEPQSDAEKIERLQRETALLKEQLQRQTELMQKQIRALQSTGRSSKEASVRSTFDAMPRP